MQSSESIRIFETEFNSDYNSDLLCDAKLRTDDGYTIDIHRIILAGNSDYFADMFCGMDRDRREFTITGISGECLSNILRYIYTGDIQVTERNVRDLMIAADYLKINDLQMEIKTSIKANMTERNCLRILLAAHLIGDQGIFQECFRFIQTRFEGLMRCKKNDLADLPLGFFKSILSNRSLYVYNETTVWQAIVEWTQKDCPFRMCCVPQLLLTLAVEDIGEELATEILQHEIISKNTFIKDLIEMRSNDFTSNLDLLLSFLQSFSNHVAQPCIHRIPPNLHVITFNADREFHDEDTKMYITYDENLDLWCKITEVDFYPAFPIAIGHNIYIFNSGKCMKFDLTVMDWVSMENFMNTYDNYSVLAIDAYIYILGRTSDDQAYVVEVYNTANNSWFNGVSPPNIYYGRSVVIDKKIYLVGNTEVFSGMMMQMFDPITQQWSSLPPPTVDRSCYGLVNYHQKIYLIGGSEREILNCIWNAEVFDPATNLWRELPNMPYAGSYAVVFNDQLIVYDQHHERKQKCFRWNDTMECWEKMDNTYILKDLRHYSFCSVDDADSIRMITKRNRDPTTQMEESLLI